MSRYSSDDLCCVEGCCKKQTQRARGLAFCGAHYSRLRKHGTTDPTNFNYAQSFIDASLQSDTDECILWPFVKVRGYAGAWFPEKKKYGRVIRIVCTRKFGEPPSDQHQSAHSCGNKLCINWKHLRWATSKENNADKVKHGTHLVGEKIPVAKLTEVAVLAIRADSRSGPLVAKQYGISVAQVSRIRARKTWSWLGESEPR